MTFARTSANGQDAPRAVIREIVNGKPRSGRQAELAQAVADTGDEVGREVHRRGYVSDPDVRPIAAQRVQRSDGRLLFADMGVGDRKGTVDPDGARLRHQ